MAESRAVGRRILLRDCRLRVGGDGRRGRNYRLAVYRAAGIQRPATRTDSWRIELAEPAALYLCGLSPGLAFSGAGRNNFISDGDWRGDSGGCRLDGRDAGLPQPDWRGAPLRRRRQAQDAIALRLEQASVQSKRVG